MLSATNADLPAEVAAGRFREDLLFRLNTVEIRLPPLRERREDIRALAAHFLRRYAARYRKPLAGFEPEAMERARDAPWPGNVRELDHTSGARGADGAGGRHPAADLGLRPGPARAAPRGPALEEVERLLIRKALERHGGNVSHAAKALGLSRSALYRRLQYMGSDGGAPRSHECRVFTGALAFGLRRSPWPAGCSGPATTRSAPS